MTNIMTVCGINQRDVQLAIELQNLSVMLQLYFLRVMLDFKIEVFVKDFFQLIAIQLCFLVSDRAGNTGCCAQEVLVVQMRKQIEINTCFIIEASQIGFTECIVKLIETFLILCDQNQMEVSVVFQFRISVRNKIAFRSGKRNHPLTVSRILLGKLHLLPDIGAIAMLADTQYSLPALPVDFCIVLDGHGGVRLRQAIGIHRVTMIVFIFEHSSTTIFLIHFVASNGQLSASPIAKYVSTISPYVQLPLSVGLSGHG